MAVLNEVEDYISTFIDSQFPDVYKQDGELMILFVKAYYEWLESSNQTLNISRDIAQYIDVDQSVSSFLEHFKKTYLFGIPEISNADYKFIIKHILDLYRSKGNKLSLELYFKLVYGINVDVYIPNEHIIKPSDSEFFTPKYVETYVNNKQALIAFNGDTITGETSGASAYVVNIVGLTVNGKVIHVFYLDNVVGEFIGNELIRDSSSTYRTRLFGSLSGVNITNGGSGFSVGDRIRVNTDNSTEGVIRVIEVVEGSGIPTISLSEGGSGYSANSEVSNIIVSNVTLEVSSISNTNILNRPANTFEMFETVTIPRSTLTFTPTSGFTNTINNKTYVIGTNSTFGHVANGLVGGFGNTSLILYRTSGNWNAAVTILVAGNTTANAIIDSYTDTTITAKYIGIKTLASGSQIIGLVDNTDVILAESQSFLQGDTSNTVADIFANRSGSNTVLSISTVGNTESSNVYTEFINSYMSTAIGNTTNPSTYGFPKDTDANTLSVLDKALTSCNHLLGEVTSITVSSSGNGYLADPIVLVQNKFVDDKLVGKREVVFDQRAGAAFEVGDVLRQSNPKTLRKFTFDTNYGDVADLTVGEGVSHSYNSTWTTTGIINSKDIDENSIRVGELKTFDENYVVQYVDDQVLTNSDSAAVFTGSISGANVSVITLAETETRFANSTSKILESYSSNNSMIVKLMSIEEEEILYVSNTYRLSTNNNSKSCRVLEVNDYTPNSFNRTEFAGLNANIFANVVIGEGVISNVDVVDSGFNFLTGNNIVFTNYDNNAVLAVNGTAIANGTGVGPGLYKTKSGFLNEDSFIHDNDFYQTYSYQVLSEYELNRYEKNLKQILHTAGFKLFGKVQVDTYNNNAITIAESDVSQA